MVNVFRNNKFNKFYAPTSSSGDGSPFTIDFNGKLIVNEGVTNLFAPDFELLTEEQINSVKIISLPASLINIADGSFNNFTSVSEYVIAATNKHYYSLKGSVLTKDSKQLVRVPNIVNQEYKVPENVEKINEFAFIGTNCETIALPKTIKSEGVPQEILDNSKIVNIIFQDYAKMSAKQRDELRVSFMDLKTLTKDELATNVAIKQLGLTIAGGTAPIGYLNAVRLQAKMANISTNELLNIIKQTNDVKLISIDEYEKGTVSADVQVKNEFVTLRGRLEDYKIILDSKKSELVNEISLNDKKIVTLKNEIETLKVSTDPNKDLIIESKEKEVLNLKSRNTAINGRDRKSVV